MSDIFDEISPDSGDVFDKVQTKSYTKYNPVSNASSSAPLSDVAIGEALPLLGGLAGGLAKTLPLRTGLSGLLAAGGEGWHQVYQHLTGDPNAPMSSTEAIKRMAYPFAEYSVGNLVGEGAVKGVSKILPRIAPEYITPGLSESGQELSKYIQPYVQKPGLLQSTINAAKQRLGLSVKQPEITPFTLAQQIDPASSAAKFESIIDSSFFGGGPIHRLKWMQNQAGQDYGKSVSEYFWKGVEQLPPSEQGKAFSKAYEIGENLFKNRAKTLYQQVDKTVGENLVQITDIKNLAKEEAKRLSQFKGIGGSESGDKLISSISDLPDVLSFSDAAELRSRLLKTAWSLESKDVAKKSALSYASSLDKTMEQSAARLSPDAKAIWREANDFYKSGKATFNNDFIVNLSKTAKEQPELVGKYLFQNGEVSQIKAVKDVLIPNQDSKLFGVVKPDKATWDNLKAGWMTTMLQGAEKKEGEALSGEALSRSLKAMGGKSGQWWTTETIKEILSPKDRLFLKNFTTAIKTTQKDVAGGGGSMLIQLMQAKPLADVATIVASLGTAGTGFYTENPEMVVGGLMILGTPKIMGKLLVNPNAQKLFLEGMNPNKAVYAPAIAKLGAMAYDIDRQYSAKDKPVGSQGVTK